MHTPESIDAALRRLMPPALSGAGRSSIESMLDDLAAGCATPPRKHRSLPRLSTFIGIAATVAIVAAWSLTPTVPAPNLAALRPDATRAVPGIVLIGETEQVEDIYDDGMLTTPDGDAVQAVRSRVVGASRFLDEETGLEVIVSQPREEVVLIPVTHF